MRWVLIRPGNSSPYYDPEIQEPLGLECLAAWLRARGHFVLVLDSGLDGANDRKLGRRAASFKPDAIGFSITTAQSLGSVLAIHAESVAAMAKSPCRWLAGGNFVSSEPRQALAKLPDTFTLVRFEGERAIADLADEWESGQPAVDGADRIRIGPAVDDLDSLPFPERPFADAIIGSGWAFNVQASRGCCGACRYCSSPGMIPPPKGGESGRRWRGRSARHVADELDWLGKRFAARSFNFVDEDFLGPPAGAAARAAAFAEELRRRELKVSFSIQVRPASLCDASIDALADVGLTYAFLGIESDDPTDFKRWARPWTDDPWRLIRRLRQRGVELNVGTLMFHSHATLAGIRRFAGRLREHGLLEYRSARNRLDAMPGSDMYEQGVLAGQIDGSVPGPQPLPFLHAEVEAFYNGLQPVLDPLGPPSMHALCSLPPLLSAQRFDPRAAPACQQLKAIIARADEAVASSFFALLDQHEHGVGTSDLGSQSGQLQTRNIQTAIDLAQDLATKGFAQSFDALREAIRIDSGL